MRVHTSDATNITSTSMDDNCHSKNSFRIFSLGKNSEKKNISSNFYLIIHEVLNTKHLFENSTILPEMFILKTEIIFLSFKSMFNLALQTD